MGSIPLRIRKLGVVYYLALLVVVFFLMRPFVVPPMMIRLALFGLIFIPTIFVPRILPAVLLLFYGVDVASFIHVLPESSSYLSAVVLICYVAYKGKSKFVLKALLAVFYFFFCAVIHDSVGDVFLWLFVTILLSDMIREREDLSLLFHSFLLVSLFLGLLFWVHQEEFAVQYGNMEEGLERSGWINNNVFGGAIAAGGVLAMAYLTGTLKFSKKRITTVLSTIVAVIVFVVLVLNASRGAFFAFVLCAAIMLLLSRSKLYIKLLLLLAVGAVIFIMYTNDTFALLQVRMESDNTATAGSRTIIWKIKLAEFFASSNPLVILFGIGQTACMKLGGFISTHNDFVTSIIAYGFVGLFLFLFFIFFFPVNKAGKKERLNVMILLLYLLVECLVLEPFFRGYIWEIMFYFFILKYVTIKDTEPAQL